MEDVAGMRWGEFKPALADVVIEHLAPIQARYAEVVADQAYLDGVLAAGAEAAAAQADASLDKCRQAMGFVPKFRPQK